MNYMQLYVTSSLVKPEIFTTTLVTSVVVKGHHAQY